MKFTLLDLLLRHDQHGKRTSKKKRFTATPLPNVVNNIDGSIYEIKWKYKQDDQVC